MRWMILWFLSVLPAFADGEKASEFDYYVLSLSWLPNWCARTGDARGAGQCDVGGGFGWTLHGLWPQYNRGWPAYCRNVQAPPSRAMTARMADIMGSSGLAWHQWKKHGTCSGLSAQDYFALSRRAYESVARPEIFRRLGQAVKLSARVVEQAFLQANPDWRPDMLTITCKGNYIEEARLCLDRDLKPVPCGIDLATDCGLPDAVFAPVR